MSADNTIIILRTKKGNGFEWRVKEIQNVEMLDWDEKTQDYAKDDKDFPIDDPEIQIVNVRWMLEHAKVHDNEKEAKDIAFAMEREHYVEYGVRCMEIDKEF